MAEKWIAWKPTQELVPLYFIDEIHDTMTGFTIKLSEYKDVQKGVLVIFEGGVEGYRITDESYRQKLFPLLNEKEGIGLLGKWTFFKVENSEYVHWLSEQSYTWFDRLQATHFAFVTGNDILDVVNIQEPKITTWESHITHEPPVV